MESELSGSETKIQASQPQRKVVFGLVQQASPVLIRTKTNIELCDKLRCQGPQLEQSQRLPNAAVHSDAEGRKGTFLLDKLGLRRPPLGEKPFGMRIDTLVLTSVSVFKARSGY